MALSKNVTTEKRVTVKNLLNRKSSSEEVFMGLALDRESIVNVVNMLTDLYKNPVEATVREIVSNAIDATVLAGSDKPVEITAPTSFAPVFEVRDYGVGMSRDEVKEVYTQYGNSTKRDDFTQIGAKGMGAKAPLSYCVEYSVETVKDGVATFFTVGRNANGNYAKISESVPTSKPNGTTVKVPVATKDVSNFASALESYRRYSFNCPVLIDGTKTSKDLIYITDIVLDEETNTVGSVWFSGTGVNFVNDAYRVMNYSDTRYPTTFFDHHNTSFVMSGWVYGNPRNSRSYAASGSQYIIELKPGVVDFSTSRDEITANARFDEFFENVTKSFEHTVANYEFLTSFIQDLMESIPSFTDYVKTFIGLRSLYNTRNSHDIYFYGLMEGGRLKRADGFDIANMPSGGRANIAAWVEKEDRGVSFEPATLNNCFNLFNKKACGSSARPFHWRIQEKREFLSERLDSTDAQSGVSQALVTFYNDFAGGWRNANKTLHAVVLTGATAENAANIIRDRKYLVSDTSNVFILIFADEVNLDEVPDEVKNLFGTVSHSEVSDFAEGLKALKRTAQKETKASKPAIPSEVSRFRSFSGFSEDVIVGTSKSIFGFRNDSVPSVEFGVSDGDYIFVVPDVGAPTMYASRFVMTLVNNGELDIKNLEDVKVTVINPQDLTVNILQYFLKAGFDIRCEKSSFSKIRSRAAQDALRDSVVKLDTFMSSAFDDLTEDELWKVALSFAVNKASDKFASRYSNVSADVLKAASFIKAVTQGTDTLSDAELAVVDRILECYELRYRSLVVSSFGESESFSSESFISRMNERNPQIMKVVTTVCELMSSPSVTCLGAHDNVFDSVVHSVVTPVISDFDNYKKYDEVSDIVRPVYELVIRKFKDACAA